MPTQSEQKPEVGSQKSDWAARSDKPRRSVFANYVAAEPGSSRLEEALPSNPKSDQCLLTPAATDSMGLQGAIDTAMARAFLFQFLARAFEDPADEGWAWLNDSTTQSAFWSAVQTLASSSASLEKSAAPFAASLECEQLEPFQIAYVTAFGHAARGDCPLNEIEYGDLKADPLFQPHRLADLAAFYRAFGLEVAEGAAERQDHICLELEFMSVLAAKEAYAHEHQLDSDQLALCRDAQKKFLREHLGRWTPAFSRRLARAATSETLSALAEFTREFIAADCARFGLTPGSEDLLLRPVDEASERVCDACGIAQLPPGAVAAGAIT